MENRIREMESALAAAIAKPEHTDPVGHDIEKQMGISDHLSMMKISEHGGSQFVGRSAAASNMLYDWHLKAYRRVIWILPILPAWLTMGFGKDRKPKFGATGTPD